MCRKNLFYAGILLAFGGGLVLSLMLESVLLRLLLSAVAMAGGCCLLRG